MEALARVGSRTFPLFCIKLYYSLEQFFAFDDDDEEKEQKAKIIVTSRDHFLFDIKVRAINDVEVNLLIWVSKKLLKFLRQVKNSEK